MKIALFASGSGTNVENILQYFAGKKTAEFPLVLSNKSGAYVHERAKKWGISSFTLPQSGFENGEALGLLKQYEVEFIVLAGFLLKIPDNLLKAYPRRIINIHPALLPKFGGKGMYGSRVHETVVANKEIESGITIHYVNEYYDEGETIFQAHCTVLPTDSPADVASKVHALEYHYFPRIIEKVISSLST